MRETEEPGSWHEPKSVTKKSQVSSTEWKWKGDVMRFDWHVIYGRYKALSINDGDKTVIKKRKTSPRYQKRSMLTNWLQHILISSRHDEWLLQSSTSLTLNRIQLHTPPSQPRPMGRCEVIARVKSGVHHRGQMANTWSHFHTWCLPQKNINIKALCFSPKKLGWIQYLQVKTTCCLLTKVSLLVEKWQNHYCRSL